MENIPPKPPAAPEHDLFAPPSLDNTVITDASMLPDSISSHTRTLIAQLIRDHGFSSGDVHRAIESGNLKGIIDEISTVQLASDIDIHRRQLLTFLKNPAMMHMPDPIKVPEPEDPWRAGDGQEARMLHDSAAVMQGIAWI